MFQNYLIAILVLVCNNNNLNYQRPNEDYLAVITKLTAAVVGVQIAPVHPPHQQLK